MGPRSQIYVVVVDKNGCKDLVVANYYQWNYGERMISRARGIVEWLQYYKEKNYLDFFMDNRLGSYKKRLSCIVDTNFDMRDIAISHNILKEVEEFVVSEQKKNPDFKATPECFRDVVFDGQDNNDGQLYIQVSPAEIKYAFTGYEVDSKPMTADEYIIWDDCDGRDLDEEEKDIMKNNVAFIEENAALMSQEELTEFKNFEYPVVKEFIKKNSKPQKRINEERLLEILLEYISDDESNACDPWYVLEKLQQICTKEEMEELGFSYLLDLKEEE